MLCILLELIESDQFNLLIKDAFHYLVWPYMGLNAGREIYSGYYPAWNFSHMPSYWIKALYDAGVLPSIEDVVKNITPDDFINAVHKFMEMKTLTAPMLRELIDHIDVYEKTGGKKNYTQRIVIFYRFVGFIEIPRTTEDENYIADTRAGVEVEYIPAKSA